MATMAGYFRDNLNSSSSSRPTFLSVFDRVTHYPIFSTLCGCLSIAEIVRLTRTCKQLSGLYRDLLPSQWDVDRALRRYFNDPLGFRSQMAKCGVLIFGSFANDFFERTWSDNQSLHLMVQKGVDSDLLHNYLSDSAGYSHVEPSSNFTAQGSPDVKEVLNHSNPQPHISLLIHLRVQVSIFKRDPNSKTKIYLYITIDPPIQSVIEEAKTTDLAVLSWNKAYSVFALPTSIQQKRYLLLHYASINKEETQDNPPNLWRAQGVMWPEDNCDNHPIREYRRVGDRYSWMIPFDTRKVEWSQTPDYVLESACFKMDLSTSYSNNCLYNFDTEDVRHYGVEAYTLKSPVLKHAYVVGDDLMAGFLERRLHAATVLELRKLDPSQRPTNYDAILRSLGSVGELLLGFQPPASWTYRDYEMPRWYRAFEKYNSEAIWPTIGAPSENVL